jgi:hypothetical protein
MLRWAKDDGEVIRIAARAVTPRKLRSIFMMKPQRWLMVFNETADMILFG